MKKVDFETFMRESAKKRSGSELTFVPNIKSGFQSGSFDAGEYVVFGAVSEIHTILVFDRRNASHLTPRSREEILSSLVAKIPKGETVLIPVQRSYPDEFIGHGLAEMIPNEIIGVFISSGPMAAQLDDAYKRKN